MNPYRDTTNEDRRSAGYELRPSANGDGLAMHDLRRANQPADPGPDVNAPIAPVGWGHVTRRANRAPDAVIDPADVAQLDRIQNLANERAVAMAQRDSLLEQVKTLEASRAALIRERNEALAGEGVRETVLVAELRAEQRATRRACYLAALLFVALCGRDGWWIAKWIWGMM